MNFEKEQKIEELLNSYLDGELSARERTEVQRLVAKDKDAARRLRALERCRLLVSSLPPAEPPAEVIAGIQKSLHYKTAVADERDNARRGARHLLVRQVLAASIIVGLAGLLIAVVYRIVGPEKTTPGTVAVKPRPVEMEKTVAAGDKAGVGFYSLQLQTADFVAVDAFVNKMLSESHGLRFDATRGNPGRSIYRVLCGRKGLEELVSDLAPAWTQFDSATLVVHTGAGQYVTVESVQPEQITKIANQDTTDGRIRMAKDFAALNDIERLYPARQVLALVGRDYPELTAIPRPVLTSGEKRVAKMPTDASQRLRVDLTIIVSGSTSLTAGGHK